MALRLVRQTSNTPNITNKDDTIMTRYAYGYNGVVKNFGNECNYISENGIFKILDGRIVIDGWEIEIDGAGWILDLHFITGTRYHSVYAEVNVLSETVKIDSSYFTGVYPEIEKGDDLTSIPNGTARILLYNVFVENGTIKEVIKKFEIIERANAKTVNGIPFKKSSQGLLTSAQNLIVPQRKILWESKGGEEIPTKEKELNVLASDIENKYIEFHFALKAGIKLEQFWIPKNGTCILGYVYYESIDSVDMPFPTSKTRGIEISIAENKVIAKSLGFVGKLFKIVEIFI